MLKYSFQKYQPLSLRVWHWMNATVILGLLGTVLLRKTFLSWRTNAALIELKLKEVGTIITPEFAKDIAIGIRNPLWNWHIYLGFAMATLFLGRILIAIFIEKRSLGTNAIKSILGLKTIESKATWEAIHYTIVMTSYVIFYLFIILMITTGFMLNFKETMGFSKLFLGIIKEIHELSMWFFVVFVVGHLLGVITAENSKNPGIISDMVNGGSNKNRLT